MIADINARAKARMEKSVEAMKVELSKLHTGRVSSTLVDHLKITCYAGEVMPLNQLASIVVEDARTLTISPWDKTVVSAIEKALMKSDLGLNPTTAGTVIRVTVPPLSEERRKELVRVVREIGENARIAVRNIRRDANSEIKELTKEKAMSEDEQKRAEVLVQKTTDGIIADIDKFLTVKETDLLKV